MTRLARLIIVGLVLGLATLGFIRNAANAAPIVTFAWDKYPVDATHNTGANKFILQTKVGTAAYVTAPEIPITATTVSIDIAGRKGTTVSGRIKACRPGSYANPATTVDQCSVWSNKATKVLSPPVKPGDPWIVCP